MLAQDPMTKRQESQPHAAARAAESNGLFKHAGVPLKVESLVKHYTTGAERVVALSGVTLEVQPGRPVGLVGVSGCGKSTLLNLVGGVDRPDSGSVLVEGVNVTRLGEREVEEYRLSKVGFVFQSYNLVPSLTAAENLQLPMVMLGDLSRTDRQQRARELLALVGLTHKANKRPDELSGGEQQRVAIGVALSNDPTILLADEPTANLDHRNLETVFELLNNLAHTYRKTVIIATHDPRVWSRLEVVVKMEEGQVIAIEHGSQASTSAGAPAASHH